MNDDLEKKAEEITDASCEVIKQAGYIFAPEHWTEIRKDLIECTKNLLEQKEASK